MRLLLIYTFLSLCSLTVCGQTNVLPYSSIPEYPADYSPGSVISRSIDGLGYRYYWATEKLTQEDLAYQVGGGGRGMLATLHHLHGLSIMIMRTATNQPNIGNNQSESLTFEELRLTTLDNLSIASKAFSGKNKTELTQMAIVFGKGASATQLPLWHLINGPIADALYHTGQVVVFRRSSGNPMNPKVNVFMGRTGQ